MQKHCVLYSIYLKLLQDNFLAILPVCEYLFCSSRYFVLSSGNGSYGKYGKIRRHTSYSSHNSYFSHTSHPPNPTVSEKIPGKAKG